jgi:hypothetical protein
MAINVGARGKFTNGQRESKEGKRILMVRILSDHHRLEHEQSLWGRSISVTGTTEVLALDERTSQTNNQKHYERADGQANSVQKELNGNE